MGGCGSFRMFEWSAWLPPFSLIFLPPDRMWAEEASWRDFWSVLYLETFTDEIENRTMNSAIRSVIMSAYVRSQRSSFSCPACPRRRRRRLPAAAMALRRLGHSRRALRGAGLGCLAFVGRHEGQQLVGHHARVVARLDGEDALESEAAQLFLLVGEQLQLVRHREEDEVGARDAVQGGDERA